PSLGKGKFAQVFEVTKSPRRQRRKTFSSIFNRKESFAVTQPKKKLSETVAPSGKSSSYQKLRMIRGSKSSSRMNLPPMMFGSTPDLSIIAEQSSRSFTDSPDEAKSAENTLTKSNKVKRRFTFTRSKSPKSGTRRNSEAVTQSGEFSSNLFRRRKESTQGAKVVSRTSKRDSSDESSINWSIPSDLPGIVEGKMDRGSMENMFAEVEELRARCQSTPTIAERRESISSVDTEEMRVPHNGPIMVNVGVQVDTADPIFQFPSAFPGSHYGFYHSGSNRSPPETRSVPQSPYSLGRNRRSGAPRVVSWGVSSMGNGDVMRPLDQRLDGTSSRRTAHIGSSPQLNTGRTNGHFTDTQKRDNEKQIMRESSLDSVSTDLDDVCGKHLRAASKTYTGVPIYHQQETDVGLNYHKYLLLDIGLQSIQFTNALNFHVHPLLTFTISSCCVDSLVSSLQNLTVESSKLHEDNVTLHQENL
ncbi:hypothetical protein GBAR_LOCUS28044, partial [Geodia barretti]